MDILPQVQTQWCRVSLSLSACVCKLYAWNHSAVICVWRLIWNYVKSSMIYESQITFLYKGKNIQNFQVRCFFFHDFYVYTYGSNTTICILIFGQIGETCEKLFTFMRFVLPWVYIHVHLDYNNNNNYYLMTTRNSTILSGWNAMKVCGLIMVRKKHLTHTMSWVVLAIIEPFLIIIAELLYIGNYVSSHQPEIIVHQVFWDLESNDISMTPFNFLISMCV